jgi:hypothetical protein
MNLISCCHCGVVLNKDNITFADDLLDEPEFDSDEYEEWHQENFVWDGDEFVCCTKCPVCGEKVRKDGGIT